MRRFILPILVGGILLTAAGRVHAEEDVRLANGMLIKGTVIRALPEGIEIQTPKGPKTYTWETLAPGTRYRHQPVYRANYDAILAGLPPSRRTRKAETDKPLPPVTTAQPVETPKPAETPKSLRLEDQVVYDNVGSLSTADIPNLQLRTPQTAAYWGLQFGPRNTDILYVVFDAKSPEEVRDNLFIYIPSHPDYGQTVQDRGTRKRVGENFVSKFKDFTLESRFNDIAATYRIEFTYMTGQARDLDVLIDVELSSGDKKSRFLLSGQPTDLVYGEGVINVRGILDLPVMWIGLDPASPQPRLIGDLRMSRMKLCPKRGMSTAVDVEVLGQSGGSPIETVAVKMDESILQQDYGLICELQKVDPGAQYTVEASIDLGPFLGTVSAQEKITIPARAK